MVYLVGEFLNAYKLVRPKIATCGRLLWVRTIGSTLAGQLADLALFIAIAFAGVLPDAALPRVVLTQWLFKTTFEATAIPLT